MPWHGLTAVEQTWKQGDFSRGTDSKLPATLERCGEQPHFQSPKKGEVIDRAELAYLRASHDPSEEGYAASMAASRAWHQALEGRCRSLC